jgi:hypothetical protein
VSRSSSPKHAKLPQKKRRVTLKPALPKTLNKVSFTAKVYKQDLLTLALEEVKAQQMAV